MAHWTVRVKTTEETDEGKLIRKIEPFLVKADTIEESQARIRDYFKGMTLDYEFHSVSKSNIIGYIDGEGNVSE